MVAQVRSEGTRLLVIVRDEAPGCPKCGASREGRAACARCGLASVHMDAFREARDARVPPAMNRAWQAARAHWHDAGCHDELLQLAVQEECFAAVASRYREVARSGDPIAVAQLARLRRAAEVTYTIGTLARAEPTTARGPYRGIKVLLALMIIAVGSAWLHARIQHAQPAVASASTR